MPYFLRLSLDNWVLVHGAARKLHLGPAYAKDRCDATREACIKIHPRSEVSQHLAIQGSAPN